MRYLTALLLVACPLLMAEDSASPSFALIHVRTMSACEDFDSSACLRIFSESRTLRITPPEGGATAYLIQIVTPDVNGARRTWQYVAPRHEQRYGKFEDKTSATFFSLPIDLDIPILDIWVTALSPSGKPSHQAPPAASN